MLLVMYHGINKMALRENWFTDMINRFPLLLEEY